MSAASAVSIGASMSPKATLQAIAGLRVDHTTNTRAVLADVMRLASAALVDRGSGQAKRDYDDRQRALLAINRLRAVLSAPSSVLMTHCGDTLPASFIPAIQSEHDRLLMSIDDPQALRAIYRRNERRR